CHVERESPSSGKRIVTVALNESLRQVPFWGQVFSHQNSGLSSNRLFGARFSATGTQVCRRLIIAFLGPGFQPPRLRFVVESPFWGQVFSRQDSGLSSNRLFRAVFSATKAQLCRRIAFLGLGFQPPRLSFVVESVNGYLLSR
ncbi:MAG: hypothetical protein B6247_30780, partial [Candidatus Parabeggiatoa sp. nov. 2]